MATFHDLFVLTGEYSTPEFRRRFAQQARQAAAEAEAIITVSRFTARQVEELLGVEPSRIHVVHHGITVRPASAVARSRRMIACDAAGSRSAVGSSSTRIFG